jgi:hypothetical protein
VVGTPSSYFDEDKPIESTGGYLGWSRVLNCTSGTGRRNGPSRRCPAHRKPVARGLGRWDGTGRRRSVGRGQAAAAPAALAPTSTTSSQRPVPSRVPAPGGISTLAFAGSPCPRPCCGAAPPLCCFFVTACPFRFTERGVCLRAAPNCRLALLALANYHCLRCRRVFFWRASARSALKCRAQRGHERASSGERRASRERAARVSQSDTTPAPASHPAGAGATVRPAVPRSRITNDPLTLPAGLSSRLRPLSPATVPHLVTFSVLPQGNVDLLPPSPPVRHRLLPIALRVFLAAIGGRGGVAAARTRRRAARPSVDTNVYV